MPADPKPLEGLLARGPETALLRFSLGNIYLQANDTEAAIPHLERAVALDPAYSAAWKLLGRAQTAAGLIEAAAETYRRGIAVAEARGDMQAAKEMRVFLNRLKKPSHP